MGPVVNAVLGVCFLVLGAAGTFLMFHLWGYPFDHESMRSSAPPRLMRLHRLIGWLYLLIYIYFMYQMVPRMWAYQIELPARTVAHLCLGISIGALIFIKIAIVRFFKHLESTLIPALGTALLLCTVLLIGLSAPFAFREAYLRAQQTGGSFTDETLERVAQHLELAGLEDPERLAYLASSPGLEAGQDVLLDECVTCHDLRTVLARPRTPADWRQTVRRMADRSTSLSPITEQQQWEVTAYLTAISPELQKSARERRERQQQEEGSQRAVVEAAAREDASAGPSASVGDPEQALQLFETRCALCHPLAVVEAAPPDTEEAARDLVARMVGNGLTANESEVHQLVSHLIATYVEER